MYKTIGIVGNGVVGNATARAFMEWAEVRIYDKEKTRTVHTLEQVLECELVFLCLPTPKKLDNLYLDTSYITGFLDSLETHKRHYECLFALRSTVPIGTTNRLARDYEIDMVHNPEFLTARCAVTDAQCPTRSIIGYVDLALSKQRSIVNRFQAFLETRYKGIACHVMSSDESEAVKLFQNSFFASKIAFFNEIHTLSTKLGLRWQTVLSGMMADGRIAQSHTNVPGPDGKYGYGGSCLPKDIAQVISHLEENSLCSNVTRGAYARNITDRVRES